jgi:hypothetical protein
MRYLLAALFALAFFSCSDTQKANTKTEEAKADNETPGTVLGKYFEGKSTNATYILYENESKTYMRLIMSDGSTLDDEVKKSVVDGGVRIDYIEGGYAGEYFIQTSVGLDFYNKENKKFTSAYSVD